MKIAVIGAGVMGLATAWALRRRGYEPVVYEQFALGHDRGSSHGRSRIFRLDGERPIPSVVSFKPGRHTHEMYSLHDSEYGLKVGAHHAGPEADPNVPGEPEPALIERIAAWAAATYRLDDATPVGAETCMYTTTADETFILERRGRIVIGSPCSGHGFKFAPAIGERLAALAVAAAG